jgi:hypothetical protein
MVAYCVSLISFRFVCGFSKAFVELSCLSGYFRLMAAKAEYTFIMASFICRHPENDMPKSHVCVRRNN